MSEWDQYQDRQKSFLVSLLLSNRDHLNNPSGKYIYNYLSRGLIELKV